MTDRHAQLAVLGPAGMTAANALGGPGLRTRGAPAVPREWRATVLAGTAMTASIAAQVAVTGLRSPLQPVMSAVGVALIGLGRRLA